MIYPGTVDARALAVFLLLAALSRRADAQHAPDNPLAKATDAFGLTLGLESVGLYSSSNVRGFSPEDAGNLRIEGLYFDQRAALSDRVIEGSSVRIGLGAIGYTFPAPTGIVDYRLRRTADADSSVTAILKAGPFGARGLSIDGRVGLIPRSLDLPFGASYESSTSTDGGWQPGYTSRIASVGATPSWVINQNITLRALLDWSRTTHAKTFPSVYTAGEFLPPRTRRGYSGQEWAQAAQTGKNAGLLVGAPLGKRWSLSAGLFRSIADSPRSFADLYLDTQPDGLASHWMLSYPAQHSASTSGEVRLRARLKDGASSASEIVLMARARNVRSKYGGEDAVDLGPANIGQNVQLPEPHFQYSERNSDRVQLWDIGAAYNLRGIGGSQLSIGLQRQHYFRQATLPGQETLRLTDTPWRAYVTAARTLNDRFTVHTSFLQGLEDSGVAPDDAENRGTLLPAAATRQFDVGLQYAVTPGVTMAAIYFELTKPYFNIDSAGVDRKLGEQRAKGLELSVAGALTPHISINAGAVLGHVTVAGPTLEAEGIGSTAFGQPRVQYAVDLDYRVPRAKSLSLDVSVGHFGKAYTSLNNVVVNGPVTTIALGGRYRFKVLNASATLRAQLQNSTNAYLWDFSRSPGYSQFSPRAFVTYLTVDF